MAPFRHLKPAQRILRQSGKTTLVAKVAKSQCSALNFKKLDTTNALTDKFMQQQDASARNVCQKPITHNKRKGHGPKSDERKGV